MNCSHKKSFNNLSLSGPPVSIKHLEPPEDRLKGSQSSLPSYNEATSGIFNNQQNNKKDQKTNNYKKKIIPVQSDFESSSPSPDPLGTPPDSPAPPNPTSCTVRMSQSTVNLARHQEMEVSWWWDGTCSWDSSNNFRMKELRNLLGWSWRQVIVSL